MDHYSRGYVEMFLEIDELQTGQIRSATDAVYVNKASVGGLRVSLNG